MSKFYLICGVAENLKSSISFVGVFATSKEAA